MRAALLLLLSLLGASLSAAAGDDAEKVQVNRASMSGHCVLAR